MRMGTGVGGAAEIVSRWLESDIRTALPHVSAPTLVKHRVGDRALDVGNARYLAQAIQNAHLELLKGEEDTVRWAGDVDSIAAAIESWLPMSD
jgi:pimeloyl-ACP methyl ester carboxylesterase